MKAGKLLTQFNLNAKMLSSRILKPPRPMQIILEEGMLLIIKND